MKKALKETALTFLLTIVCLSILFLLAILFDRPIPGDIDNNGAVNQTDLYLIAGYVIKEVELNPEQIKAADVNSDGRVNSMDLTIVAKQIEKED